MTAPERGKTSASGAGTEVAPAAPGPAGGTLVTDVFGKIADRLADRIDDLAAFAASAVSFQPWLVWEAMAALSSPPGGGARCIVQPRPAYAFAGVPGSRDVADLLVTDVATARRVMIEIVVINDWSANKWIDNLDAATRRLSRTLVPGIVPLQIVVAASTEAPIDVNHQWQQWLGMSRVWNRETDLRRTLPLGTIGQLIVTAWDLGAGD